MAFDAFLKIDGIEGSSQQKGHEKEIEISSFSWGESNAGTAGTGSGGGAGKVQMQDFHFTMATSKASESLQTKCETGEHIREATLTCRKAGREQFDSLTIKMSDVLISSYALGGATGGDDPTDQASLSFVKIDMAFIEQGPTG